MLSVTDKVVVFALSLRNPYRKIEVPKIATDSECGAVLFSVAWPNLLPLDRSQVEAQSFRLRITHLIGSFVRLALTKVAAWAGLASNGCGPSTTACGSAA